MDREITAAELEADVLATPEEAFQAIDRDSSRAGGPWQPRAGYEGSIGSTMFDTPASRDGTVTVLLPPASIDALPSQALVRIESVSDGRTYLGAVVEGPFAEPDGLRADSTPMVVATVQGGLLMPRHHGQVQVEILGEQIENGAVVPPRRRPKPNSPVFLLDAQETSRVLRLEGNLRLGLADGFDELCVSVPADSKSVFPRHLGILGTTGGGKSTTVSGLIAKARQAGMAIVLVDTEGEYCAIHEPTDRPDMKEALARRGLEPAGVGDTHVFHPVGRETANPGHPAVSPFSLEFSQLSPYAVQEILELTEAQETRFFEAYDATKRILERLRIWPANESQRQQLAELDELETGYPGMELAHLYDVIKAVSASVEARENGQTAPPPFLETKAFSQNRREFDNVIRETRRQGQGHTASWRALQGKLAKIKRLGIFDSPQAPALDYEAMLRPGRVSILDLSDTDSPQINNLVIAELLRGVHEQQERGYKAAIAAGRQPTPALVFIEEAHEFLSDRRIKQMPVLFQQVARIARRGRKRWLGLVFITQLPQHLPDEVLGLINNWVLHKIGDAAVVNRLRKSIGGINESLWRNLPSLAPGQAVVSFTTLARPLQMSIDPTPCRLLMVE
jgi:DNA helicase HerA-like ATPase